MTAYYHPHPSPHFVFSADTWEQLKANPAVVRPEPGIPTAGVESLFAGAPVYLDGCPWDCEGSES